MASNSIEYHDLGPFTFTNGKTLDNARLAYRIFNPAATKSALVPTCFGGRIDQTQSFHTEALQDHRVVVVAMFGNGESSSPSNHPDFPDSLDYRDCIHAQYKLVKHLGIDTLDVVAGFSMGGQIAYHWAVMYPEFVKHAVVICSSSRTSPHNRQFLEGPKYALINASDYGDDSSAQRGEISKAIKAFGKAYSAWLTSAEWFDQELWTEAGFDTLADWDRNFTEDSKIGWTGSDLLALLGMWQRGDVGNCVDGGGTEAALRSIKAKVLLMPGRTDQYFRPEPNERDAKVIKDVKVSVIESVWGHVAGWGVVPADSKFMNDEIAAFIK